jgi:tRNA nucleotidyltransferase/poly(A) polymerase
MIINGFNASLPKPVFQVVSAILEGGFECYIVGGALRDYFLNRPVEDYDIATSATPQEVKKLFRRVLPIGQGHGTVTVIVKGCQIEVTTFRSSSPSNTSTTSVTSPASTDSENTRTSRIKADLACRDYTINAISWTMENSGSSGTVSKEKGAVKDVLFDPFDGVSDIEQRVLRMIGGRELNFLDDPLRVLRGCRFAAACNLSVETATFSAMGKFSNLIMDCAVERIFVEITKLLSLKAPSIGLELLFSTELVNAIFAVDSVFTLPSSFDRQYLLKAIDLVSEPIEVGGGVVDSPQGILPDSGITVVRLAILLQSILSWQDARCWLLSMKAPKEMIGKLGPLFELALMEPGQITGAKEVRRFFSRFDKAMFYEIVAFWRGTGSDAYASFAAIAFSELSTNPCVSVKELAVNGKMIMTHLNIEPGVRVGEILNSLLEFVIDDPSKNNREFLLKMAMRLYNNQVS